MASRTLCCVALVPIALVTPRIAVAQAADATVTVEQGAVESFHADVCGHYGVSRADVVVIKAKKVSDEELPVVFLIARKASSTDGRIIVTPVSVAEMRLSGKSWMEIALHFRLTAEVFHVELARDPGPPHGKAWGHFKNRPRGEWGQIRLADDEVVQLVNVKFLAERRGCAPETVISLRAREASFVSLAVKLEKPKGSPGQGKGNGPDGSAGAAMRHDPKLPLHAERKGQGGGKGQGKRK